MLYLSSIIRLHEMLIIFLIDCKPSDLIMREEVVGRWLLSPNSRLQRKSSHLPMIPIMDLVLLCSLVTFPLLSKSLMLLKLDQSVSKINDTSCTLYILMVPTLGIGVNCYGIVDSNAPFGGYKQSGIGRECGEYALENYYLVKSIKINVSL